MIKAIVIFLLLRVFTTTRVSIETALALVQVGEFSFAVFALAGATGLVSETLMQIMIPVVMLSLLFTSLILRHLRAFACFFYRRSCAYEQPIVGVETVNHVIVRGYTTLGQKIIEKLKASHLLYLAIEHNGQAVQEGQKRGDVVFSGVMLPPS